jgi:hypothetical protein
MLFPRDALHFDIEVDQAAPPLQHTGRGLDILMLRWREIGDGQTHGCATHVLGHCGIRPGRNHGRGVDQRAD